MYFQTTGRLKCRELAQAMVQGYGFFLPGIVGTYVWETAIPHAIGLGAMLILNNTLYLAAAGRALDRLPDSMGKILMDRMLVYVLSMTVVLVCSAVVFGMLFVAGYVIGFGIIGTHTAQVVTGTVCVALPLGFLTMRLWPAYALPVVYDRPMVWLTPVWFSSMMQRAWRLTQTPESLRRYGLAALVALLFVASGLLVFVLTAPAASQALIGTLGRWLIPTLVLPFCHLVIVDRTYGLLHHSVPTAQAQPGTQHQQSSTSPRSRPPSPERAANDRRPQPEALPTPSASEPDEEHIVLTYPSGEKRAEGVNKQDRAHGPWLFWYENGVLMEEGNYADGLPHGQWIYYWRNGHKQREGTYAQGMKVGLWTSWYYHGGKASAGEYAADRETGPWHYWYEQGQIKAQGAYVEGKRHGPWQFGWSKPPSTYASDWYHGALTNVPGQPPVQPEAHKDVYYPVVPGQLAGQETPFDAPGPSAGLYFGCVTGAAGIHKDARSFTYLFQPVAPFENMQAAGLYLVIWERYAYLYILEKRLTVLPHNRDYQPPADVPAKPGSTPQRFITIADPLRRDVPYDKGYSEHTTVAEASAAAQRFADAYDCRAVVARWVADYPLDI